MENTEQHQSVWQVIKQNYRLYLGALVIVIIAELIGVKKFQVGSALIVIYPMLFAIVISVLLGPDIFRFFKEKASTKASSLVLVAITPFMAKIGVLAGSNLPKLVDVGPALAFQELGHVGTIFLALPIALLLGIKKEAIGATSSTCRDKDYGLICHLYGANSPEARGALSIYIIGFLIGTIYIGFLASIVASTDIFHPLALAMACGIGSGVMMAAASSTLATIYPEYGDQIIMLAGASDTLAAIIGIYFTLFISLPLTRKLYYLLEPRISPKHTRDPKQMKSMKVGD
ncbi:DUF3100 domain-containing protein [Micromonospora provocatoris]|uniref:DUF3100 domain-containing protein n=1 Tax=Bacillati TaxID=1783272 RepID=UPI001171BB88|nr:DUF3100 domain-containing protein [Lysinibacillus sp. CD3-6]QPQ33760.1 DUF3100 domain-containing protein [Lysinibacillus sp. JNUCC-52]UED80303.1 DUF3100 domain-containing protein [Lysinibacillus sp. CD3-6]